MSRTLPIVLAIVTLVLIILAWFQSGGVERREMESANSPDQAVRLMFSQIKSHNYDAAYARLANRATWTKTHSFASLRAATGAF